MRIPMRWIAVGVSIALFVLWLMSLGSKMAYAPSPSGTIFDGQDIMDKNKGVK